MIVKQEQNSDLIEFLTRNNQILEKSKRSQARKHQNALNRVQKKVEKLTKENQK
jgi:hypothetical protein